MVDKQTGAAAASDQLPWYRVIGWDCWRVLIAGWGVWALDAIDFLSITFVLTDIAKRFDVSLATTSLLLFATYGVRWLGGLLFGSLSDRIGRKIPLLIALAWFTLGAAFTGLAWSFAALVVFRLLLGFGMAPGFSLGATLIAETWPEKYRAIGIGIHDSGWGIGGIGAALIYGFVYPYTGWRGVFFVGVVPAILLGLFIAYFVPESAVWQRQRKPAVPAGIPAVRLFRDHPRRVAFLAVLMLLLFLSNWPMLGLFPTYLKSLHFPVPMIAELTMTTAIGQIIGFVCSGMIAERLGRRNGLTAMLVAGALCVIALVLVIHNFVLAEVAAFFSGALLIGAAGIWGSILTENLPTGVRASGVGFLYNIGSFGGGLAPFLVLFGIHRLGLQFGAGLALASVIAAGLAIIVLRFVHETRGISLEDLHVHGQETSIDSLPTIRSTQ